MKTILLILLIIHIASGFTALVAGGISMFAKKGGRIHRQSGKVYYYAMISVGATAFIISIFKNIIFLLMISVFSLYMSITGNRSLLFMRRTLSKPAMFDWLFLLISAIFLAGISWRFFVVMPFSSQGMQPVLAVFNSIFAGLLVKDVITYSRYQTQTANNWLIAHIVRMIGAYIATITAFVVTNVHTNPAYVAWLAPTVIITPVIVYYVAKYHRKAKRAVAVMS